MRSKPSNDIKTFENLAYGLGQGGTLQTAMVLHKERLYFSRVRPRPGPSSATVKLIQGIFDQHRDLSFFILRNRIWTTEDLGPMNLGMVRVAAKRVSQLRPSEDKSLALFSEIVEVGDLENFVFANQSLLPVTDVTIPTHVISDKMGVGLSIEIAQSVMRGSVLHDHNRAIGALLCDSSGKVLSWAANSAALNKTLHAEVRAVQNYYESCGKLIPRGAKLFVSLKPCQMCAGMIVESCEDPKSIQIMYAQHDSGRLAKNTVLDQMNLAKILTP